MKRSEIEASLRRAVSPSPDLLDRILKADAENGGNVVRFENIQPPKRKRRLVTAVGSAAAAFLICLGGLTAFVPRVDALVSIDVNPGVELSIDDKERVIKCEAAGADAEKVLGGMDLRKVQIDVATNAIIGSMFQNGYLSADRADNAILISVANKDVQKAEALQERLAGMVDGMLRESKTQARVYRQSETLDSGLEDLQKFADRYSISIGRADFIRKLIAKDPSLTAEELVTLPIKELARLISERGLNINDIVIVDDDDWDDDLDDKIEDTIDELNDRSGADDDRDDWIEDTDDNDDRDDDWDDDDRDDDDWDDNQDDDDREKYEQKSRPQNDDDDDDDDDDGDDDDDDGDDDDGDDDDGDDDNDDD
ncbi:anti-sigma-I factor RsgI family protein [Anaerotruncus rubiinfantis]|jgi:hypothetical protein|uniref:anti-sigma-I factor RsgI family protein n=1 Tax=Anaerotruncus rubiinfantis TaxID=1720200 RepID=UPI00164D95A5|nr:hypothetical protein [Anaerotruncus rubiinfantis]